jgi:hypothetical protein
VSGRRRAAAGAAGVAGARAWLAARARGRAFCGRCLLRAARGPATKPASLPRPLPRSSPSPAPLQRELVDSQFRPSRFPATFGAALGYVTLAVTVPAAAFTFLAFPKEVRARVPAAAALCAGSGGSRGRWAGPRRAPAVPGHSQLGRALALAVAGTPLNAGY